MTMLMIVIWLVLIATTITLELVTVGHFAGCVGMGGVVALILAACGVAMPWQILVWLAIALVTTVAVRPFLKKLPWGKVEPKTEPQEIAVKS